MSEGVNSARSDLRGGAGWIGFGLLIVGESLRMDRYTSMGATIYTMPGFVPGMIGAVLVLLGCSCAEGSAQAVRQVLDMTDGIDEAAQRIEMRRFDVLHHAMDAEIGVSVVVGVEEDDVGARRSRE